MSTWPPLHDRLLGLERRWREADERFARALGTGVASLDVALDQTHAWVEHATVLARELALAPSLRVALVREGLWTTGEAFVSCLRYPPGMCGHWIELLPLLSDEAVDALVEHTREPRWRQQGLDHVGLWVRGRYGGDTLRVQLCARLAARGERDRARALFEAIEHVGARIDALELLRGAWSDDAFVAARAELLARCRGLDPIRRHYALCELSRLHPPAEALALVEEAIAGLPAGHDWTHAPGGLMLMLLAEPVIEALDRDGLRDQLVAWAEREGEWMWANVTGGYDERLAALLGRPVEASDPPERFEPSALEAAARGELGALLHAHETIPDALLEPAIEHVRAAVVRDPSHPWPLSILLRLAARANDAAALACVAEHVQAVEWHRYVAPAPIWAQPGFDRLPRDVRARLLTTAVERLRAAAEPRLRPDAHVILQQLDAGPGAPTGDPELGARWLAGARFDADPRDASERWSVAARLWGRAGLTLLQRAVVAPVG